MITTRKVTNTETEKGDYLGGFGTLSSLLMVIGD